MFASLNYLQADIYYKIFKEKITATNFELCTFNICDQYQYAFLLNKPVEEDISTLDAKYLALDSYLDLDIYNSQVLIDEKLNTIQQDFTKQDLKFLLHQSKYPQQFNLKYKSIPSNSVYSFDQSIVLEFKDLKLTLNSNDLQSMVFIKDNKFILNPIAFLNYLNLKSINFEIPILDLKNPNDFQIQEIPDFLDLTNQVNLLLNSSSSYKKYIVKYLLPVPKLKNADNKFIQRNVLTSFYGSNFNRDHNIQNAIGKLSLITLKPNQEFSFLESIGDISKETGYKDSLVITKKGFVSQAGGGVCQVSSTLYYAALNAGFDILERYNHSKAISYYAQAFDYGLDATIYPGQKDLRFKNSFDFEITLFSYYFNSTMQTLIIAQSPIPEVKLTLIKKDITHLDNSTIELNKPEFDVLEEPEVIQNYIPKINTLWERKIGDKSDLIESYYLPQPKIVDYSKS